MVTRTYTHTVDPVTYAIAYWITELLCALVAFGVTWEIYSHILGQYPGVSKMARSVSAFLLVMVGAKAGVELWGASTTLRVFTTLEVEQLVRVLQALLLLGILGLIVHYRLPLGRNIGALLAGYGLYLLCIVVTVTLRLQSVKTLNGIVDLTQRIAWCITLGVWCVGMRSYAPTPQLETSLEYDYNRISQQTTRALGQLRSHLIHSWRP
jgi:hypothetical protein